MPTTAQLKEILIVPLPGQLQDVRIEPGQPVPKVRDNELDSLPSSCDAWEDLEQKRQRLREQAEQAEYEEACKCFKALRAMVKERQSGALSLGGRTLVKNWRRYRRFVKKTAKSDFFGDPATQDRPATLGIFGDLKKAWGEMASVYGVLSFVRAFVYFWIRIFFWIPYHTIRFAVALAWQVALPGIFILLCNERVYLLFHILNPCAWYGHWLLRKLDVGTSDAPRDIQAAYEAMAPAYGWYIQMMICEIPTVFLNWILYIILLGPTKVLAKFKLPESAVPWILFGPHIFFLVLFFRRVDVARSPEQIKRATAKLCRFYVTVGESTERKRKRLDEVLRDFVAREREDNADENLKFSSGKFVLGQPKKAALGVNRILGGSDKELWSGMGRGLQAIRDEFMEHGTDEDRECFEYVVNGTAGSLAKTWPHAGGLVMDEFRSPADEDGRAGKPLSYFVNHPSALEAELLEEHVVCLRLYTTACYRSLNSPLRERAKAEESAGLAASAPMPPPHPFKVTIAYLADGIKRLRAVGASRDDRHERRDFWRGMRNVEVPDEFSVDGGTEYAPMSTSSDLSVALAYSNKSEKRLLFKVATNGFIERGADLRFLSAFPNEAEFLYPPLTYLQPTKIRDTICIGQGSEKVEYTVIEVEPKQ